MTRARHVSELPSALARFDAIAQRVGAAAPVVFLDYDGTLTPIVDRPELAVLSDEMRQVVAALAARCTVAVISGRGLADVRALVGLDQLVYAGSHGFEIAGPEGLDIAYEPAAAFRAELDAAAAKLRARVAEIDGALVEVKAYSIAVHDRLVAASAIGRVEAAVDEVAAAHPRLKLTHGKRVYDLQPQLDWHKGKAVSWVLRSLGVGDDAFAVFIGDDLTDEDAFRELRVRGRGLGIIVVGDADRETAAEYALRDPDETATFLRRLCAALDR